MGNHRRVTEEDLHVTEALIADSFGRLKRSVAEAPHEAIRPATNLIRDHPLAATAAAAGAGVIAFQVAKMMFGSRAPSKEASQGKGKGIDVMGPLLSMAAPYITGMLQQQLGKVLSGERR
jgi:hypothetical protein